MTKWKNNQLIIAIIYENRNLVWTLKRIIQINIKTQSVNNNILVFIFGILS